MHIPLAPLKSLPIHSISTTPREAMSHISDPRGPSQWPKKIKIEAFSLEPLQCGKYHVKAAINSYPDLISSTCREAIPHIWDPRAPCHSPKLTKNTPNVDRFPSKTNVFVTVTVSSRCLTNHQYSSFFLPLIWRALREWWLLVVGETLAKRQWQMNPFVSFWGSDSGPYGHECVAWPLWM